MSLVYKGGMLVRLLLGRVRVWVGIPFSEAINSNFQKDVRDKDFETYGEEKKAHPYVVLVIVRQRVTAKHIAWFLVRRQDVIR